MFLLLGRYRWSVLMLLGLALSLNALYLAVPRLVASGIDAIGRNSFQIERFVGMFIALAVGIFVIGYLRSIAMTYVSERVAKDLRADLADSVAEQSFSAIQKWTSARLLTTLTADVDGVKMFVAHDVITVISSLFIILGASTLMILVNWRLGLAVLGVIPLIAISFAVIFSQVGSLFQQAQKVLDKLNKVINESILGASLIRLLNAEEKESQKFLVVSEEARSVGMRILRLFASLIPVVTFLSNVASLVILLLGGRFVIFGSMTLGELAAFNGYLAVLVFPILMIGFMSSMIGRAAVSYARIEEVVKTKPEAETGTVTQSLTGAFTVKDLSLSFEGKDVLKNVSFDIKPRTKNAIVGPTAAGKTQLLYLLADLLKPTSGAILFDGVTIENFKKASLHEQIGFVFQDSVLFNLTLRENICFSGEVSEAALKKAIETAELSDFIQSLPNGLDTLVSERGVSLSGGQKQRVMLARALVREPKILLLDDFTARVDVRTEQRILENLWKNYPHMTLLSVTQKITSVENYDQILLLMEGELLARGTHRELLSDSPEYAQLAQSQESTNHYE